jgi:hypothetical protein
MTDERHAVGPLSRSRASAAGDVVDEEASAPPSGFSILVGVGREFRKACQIFHIFLSFSFSFFLFIEGERTIKDQTHA